MAVHSFDLGDIVTVFQMHPSKGLLVEGSAAIVDKVEDVDEQYVVRFRGDADDDTYERFVDREGQANPQRYIKWFNDKLGLKVA